MARSTDAKHIGIEPYVDFVTIEDGGTQYEADVTVQLKKSDGNNDEEVYPLHVYVCSDLPGAVPISTPSSAHSDGGAGALIGTITSTMDALFVTNASGRAVVTITDTSETTTTRLAVIDPRTNRIHVSAAFGTNYKS